MHPEGSADVVAGDQSAGSRSILEDVNGFPEPDSGFVMNSDFVFDFGLLVQENHLV